MGLTKAPIAVQELYQMDRNRRMLVATSTAANAALPFEFGLAAPAFKIKAKKFEKKITQQPCVGLYLELSNGREPESGDCSTSK